MVIDSTGFDGATGIGTDVDAGPGNRIVGIIGPDDWTAAVVTFQVSEDGSNFQNLFDSDGNEFTVSMAALVNVGLTEIELRVLSRWRHIRPRSGTAAAAVQQAASRTLGFVVKQGE